MAFGDGTYLEVKKAPKVASNAARVIAKALPEEKVHYPFEDCPYKREIHEWRSRDDTDEFIRDLQLDLFHKALKSRRLRDGRVPLTCHPEYAERVKELGAKWDRERKFWYVRPYPGEVFDKRLRFFCF